LKSLDAEQHISTPGSACKEGCSIVINELAQWAAIAFLAIMVFGLTRQLGTYMLGPREKAALDMGPAIGSQLSSDLLQRKYQTALAKLMEDRGVGFGVVLVIDKNCETCAGILQRVRTEGVPDNAPLVAITRLAGDGPSGPMGEDVADVAIVDPERVNRARLGTPFLMIVDGSLKVRFPRRSRHNDEHRRIFRPRRR
jgi:hypothetical protein